MQRLSNEISFLRRYRRNFLRKDLVSMTSERVTGETKADRFDRGFSWLERLVKFTARVPIRTRRESKRKRGYGKT